MDFFEKVELSMQGYTNDEIKALEVAWSEVGEPIEVLMSSDGRIYVDGRLTDAIIVIEDGVAWWNEQPVVVTIPRAGGGFMYHPEFGPDSVTDARDAAFEEALAEITRKKWEEFYAAQNAPQPPAAPTMEECHARFAEDYLYLRAHVGRWRPNLCKGICKQPECPHLNGKDQGNPAAKKTWQQRRLEDAARFVEAEAALELMQSLVDQATKSNS